MCEHASFLGLDFFFFIKSYSFSPNKWLPPLDLLPWFEFISSFSDFPDLEIISKYTPFCIWIYTKDSLPKISILLWIWSCFNIPFLSLYSLVFSYTSEHGITLLYLLLWMTLPFQKKSPMVIFTNEGWFYISSIVQK